MKIWNWFKKIPRIKLIIGIIASIIVLFSLTSIMKKPVNVVSKVEETIQLVVVKQVVKKDLIISKEYLGYIEDTTVQIGADRVQGKIGEVMVSKGDEISEGNILFTLDISTDLISSELQLKEVEHGKSTLDLQISQLLPDLKKLEKLYDEGAIALNELEQLQKQLKSLELQRNQLDPQYNELIRAITVSKKQAKVLSPIDGVVEKINIVPGTYIGQDDIIKIRKNELSKCTIMVSESELDIFIKGKKVQAIVGDNIYEGTITVIKDREEEQLLFPVEIEINTIDQLLGGRTVKVMIEKYNNKVALMIPRTSVISFAGETYVYIFNEDNTVSKTNVLIGESNKNMLEIKNGLSFENRVVIKGQFSISDGEKVTWIK